MPTTKDIRSIKITANIPSSRTPKLVIYCCTGIILLAALYFLGCKIGFLPAGMCSNNNLNSNTPPLTPMPTDTPLPLALAPTQEIFPGCGLGLYAATPACGSVYSGNPEFYCGSDGTSIMTLNFTVSGEAAKKILDQQGALVESDPPGICQWTGMEPTGIDGEYNATLQCFGDGGDTVKILEQIGGTSCDLFPPCPLGYTVDTSQLQSDGEFFCIKNEHVKGNIDKHDQCAGGVDGSYLNSDKKCCETKPTTDMIFSCLNGHITDDNAHSITCGVVNDISETLRDGYTLPSCPVLDQPRPDKPDPEPDPSCVPDATGGGCP